ncbi:MAG: esterase-like activity of phytase family protein, partial [Pseudomonadota bacterium]
MTTALRVASFNASLNRNNEGDLIADLTDGTNSQAQSVAEIIQRTDADVILINEFDFDADGDAARLFQDNYLSVSQNGQDPIDYPYVFVAPSNTGVASGFDLDNSGAAGDFAPGDAQGFGFFEGQFAFAIFSKHPIDTDNIRTFQEFLWKDMPDALLPKDPNDADGNGDTENWYTAEELEVLRLSSKNHVDLPVLVDGETVHILAAHPTPPVFDGAEDRNGTRNHDEIRFWADYVNGADYIYDDEGGYGGLGEGERFVIVGDYNADPFDGDSTNGAAMQLLENPAILGSATDPVITPTSDGGVDANDRQAGFNETHLGNPAFDTADFGFAGFTDGVQNPDASPGNLRVDYALPSKAGLAYLDGGVFWQASDNPLFPLAEFPTSDHRLVYVDLALTGDDRATVEDIEFKGLAEIASGTEFEGTTLGGLSGITYNPVSGTYFAVSDDFGVETANRFYELDIDLSDGTLDDGDVTVLYVTEIDPNGFVPGSADAEGIAIGQGGQLYVSTERNADGRMPQILSMGQDGVFDGEFAVDDKFKGLTELQGVRNNLGFESLTITPDQTTLWTATEGALTQDGDRASVEAGSAARIVKYDLETGEAVAEFIYEVDPIAEAPDPADAFADSGLVELLAIDNQGTLLALERSFSIGAEDRGYTGKLYLVQTQGATNVIGEDSVPTSLDDGELDVNVDETVSKTLLADLGDFDIVVDNIEGMTLGPVLEDGRQSLIIVSDDNFSAFGPQANQFITLALELGEVP